MRACTPARTTRNGGVPTRTNVRHHHLASVRLWRLGSRCPGGEDAGMVPPRQRDGRFRRLQAGYEEVNIRFPCSNYARSRNEASAPSGALRTELKLRPCMCSGRVRYVFFNGARSGSIRARRFAPTKSARPAIAVRVEFHRSNVPSGPSTGTRWEDLTPIAHGSARVTRSKNSDACSPRCTTAG